MAPSSIALRQSTGTRVADRPRGLSVCWWAGGAGVCCGTGVGITLNMLYLNAYLWGFQWPIVQEMRKQVRQTTLAEPKERTMCRMD